MHPDPDALGSAMAMAVLLERRLGPGGAKITLATKGRAGGGINDAFLRGAHFALTPWDAIDVSTFDAIVLLDVQPQFAFCPLPPGTPVTAVVDHHRGSRGGRPKQSAFRDVRTEVGATCSLVYSYYKELNEPINPELAAAMLYAIESDLAGVAGTPGDLDNIALSGLTLVADARKLYQMRFTPLARNYYAAYAQALANAEYQANVVASHLPSLDSMEQPAVMADFLLRFDQAEWALVTAVTENRLVMSLRTRGAGKSAADVIRRMIGRLGEGGGHRTKAGGFITLDPAAHCDLAKLRHVLWRRLLRAVAVRAGKPTKLVP